MDSRCDRTVYRLLPLKETLTGPHVPDSRCQQGPFHPLDLSHPSSLHVRQPHCSHRLQRGYEFGDGTAERVHLVVKCCCRKGGQFCNEGVVPPGITCYKNIARIHLSHCWH